MAYSPTHSVLQFYSSNKCTFTHTFTNSFSVTVHQTSARSLTLSPTPCYNFIHQTSARPLTKNKPPPPPPPPPPPKKKKKKKKRLSSTVSQKIHKMNALTNKRLKEILVDLKSGFQSRDVCVPHLLPVEKMLTSVIMKIGFTLPSNFRCFTG